MDRVKRFVEFLIALLFILLLSWAGNADYEEAVRQERQYIDDVCFGLRPDWKNQQVTCKEN